MKTVASTSAGNFPLTCWFVTATGKVLKATPDHSELVQRCGSPVAALQELLYGDPDLPDGAVLHLLGLPKEQRGVLDHLLCRKPEEERRNYKAMASRRWLALVELSGHSCSREALCPMLGDHTWPLTISTHAVAIQAPKAASI